MKTERQMNSMLVQVIWVFGTLLAPSAAFAHVGVGHTSGTAHGLLHPLTGLDHIAAMVAVGLWAAQRGGRAVWAVPLAFVAAMVAGATAGMAGVAVPFVETGIVASVFVLGVLVAAAVRMPLVASAAIVGLFALFHGHSHGAEMPGTASGLSYGLGFVLATALLHGCGIGAGLLSRQWGSPRLIRYAGGAAAALGIYLFIS